MPDYKQMKQCRKEIHLLKGVWDINIYVKVSVLVVFQKNFAEPAVLLHVKSLKGNILATLIA